MTFSEQYLGEAISVLLGIDRDEIEDLARALARVRARGGRVFLLGLGGSASHASHAAADFHKLCGIKAICLTDNVPAFTAALNDYGWGWGFAMLLKQHQLSSSDALLILSVGGGGAEVSTCFWKALREAYDFARADVLAIVGRDGGHAKQMATACVLIPPRYLDHVTPHTEGLMSVVLHCLVSHPALQVQQPKWESLS